MDLSMIKNTILFDMLSRFRTGNPMYDAIISSVIFSVGMYGVKKLTDMWEPFKIKMIPFSIYVGRIIHRLMSRQKQKINKTIVIDYITDNKQINELYKAVQHFLSSSSCIDFTKESPLKLTYERKIESLTQLEDLYLNKFIPQYQSKKFFFKNHEICYTNAKETITVYTDKERKRENFTITLSTMVSSDSKIDILEDFCSHCLSEYIRTQLTKKWVQQIFINKNGKWETQSSNNKRKVDTVILKNGLKPEIMTDLQLFLQSEEWYNCRDIPYTRGYLFYGLPGTGKTSMIKGISTYCKRHIHYMMLNDIQDDHELIELMKQINYHETILVIEDIDCTIEAIKSRTVVKMEKEKENQQINELIKHVEQLQIGVGMNNGFKAEKKPTALTLSGLLNAIDGIFNNDGRILIMTTNHPEILDDALIRPGRIDRKFCFENCDKHQIMELYEMFFNQKCDARLLENLGEEEYSPAYIAGLFLRYRMSPNEALLHLNKGDDKPVITSLFPTQITTNTPSPTVMMGRNLITPPNISFPMTGDMLSPIIGNNVSSTSIIGVTEPFKDCAEKQQVDVRPRLITNYVDNSNKTQA